jgi:hypothetical protein
MNGEKMEMDGWTDGQMDEDRLNRRIYTDVWTGRVSDS